MGRSSGIAAIGADGHDLLARDGGRVALGTAQAGDDFAVRVPG
jgi:hypothetical protein